ncbi:hypothetical protein LLR47_19425 [Bacillus cereus]|nr:hypothetical protein [Bacillus cereus]MCC3687383.1 hypothetical protein [Bacillus cereus]
MSLAVEALLIRSSGKECSDTGDMRQGHYTLFVATIWASMQIGEASGL